MIILGIETSCDETAAAVVKDGRILLSSVIASAADIFAKYGGVVPEIASRKHVEFILPVIDQALKQADYTLKDIDKVAVTYGPGLVGALLVGLSAAKAIAVSMDIPIVGVNHLKAHIAANYVSNPDIKPPFLCLLVSGGHTNILKVLDYDRIESMGQTRDDAVGEAYDKVGRVLGLEYPGGPKIDKMAILGDPEAIAFPRTKFRDDPYDFSFSGLKTAVINYMNTKEQKNETVCKEDVAASFQKAVTDVLVDNVFAALREAEMGKKIVLAGGVAANKGLRNALEARAGKENVKIYYPPITLCTDNAAMVASAAFYIPNSNMELNADPSLEI
ncbi:MAG: tRNA (adenosine(37)-N6)-threonylcarbamoyltransferase complex transferase subunit TsaD [Clostridia bacterium]